MSTDWRQLKYADYICFQILPEDVLDPFQDSEVQRHLKEGWELERCLVYYLGSRQTVWAIFKRPGTQNSRV